LSWVKPADREQCEWVISKLKQKKLGGAFYDPKVCDPYERIKEAISYWPDPNDFNASSTDPNTNTPEKYAHVVLELAETCEKLRDAWEAHKRRNKNRAVRSFSFTMKRDVQKRIKELSQRWHLPRDATVERALRDCERYEQAADNHAREAVAGELSRMTSKIDDLNEKLRVARGKPSKSLLPRNMISAETQNAQDINIKIDALTGMVSGMSDQLVALQSQLLQITKTNSNGEYKLQGHVDEGGVAVHQGGVVDQNPQCAGDVGNGELVTATEGDGRPKALDSKQGLTEVGAVNLELHHEDVTEARTSSQADEQAVSEAQQEEEQSVIEDPQVDQAVTGANHPEVASEKLGTSALPDIEPPKDKVVEVELCSANHGYQPITGPVELSEQVRNMGPKELPEQVENIRMGAQLDENYVDQICWQYSIFKHGEEDIVEFANKKKDSILKGWQGRQK
jgi:predicted transcriptional regulator